MISSQCKNERMACSFLQYIHNKWLKRFSNIHDAVPKAVGRSGDLHFKWFTGLLALSSLNLPLSSSSTTAANCCRNSRLVVDEDDLKWVTTEKIYCYF